MEENEVCVATSTGVNKVVVWAVNGGRVKLTQ